MESLPSLKQVTSVHALQEEVAGATATHPLVLFVGDSSHVANRVLLDHLIRVPPRLRDCAGIVYVDQGELDEEQEQQLEELVGLSEPAPVLLLCSGASRFRDSTGVSTVLSADAFLDRHNLLLQGGEREGGGVTE